MNNSTDIVTQHLRGLAIIEPAGTRLPSVRDLMRDLKVSPVTVQAALERLGREGVVEARPGQGTFVLGRAEAPVAQPDLAWQSVALGARRVSADRLASLLVMPRPGARALSLGYLPESLQATALLAAAAGRAMRRPGVWGRMPIEGLEPLRAWFAQAAGGFSAHEVTICPGTQSANAAAFRALAGSGDAMLIESPTYSGAIAGAQAAGLRLVPVPTDEDGVRPDLLEDAFQRSGARLFYCQPTYANPTGRLLSAERRSEVLAVVRRAGAFLIEDDWARDFGLDGEPPPPLAPAETDGHVVYVRSLTKCAAPGLRIGAICARGAALERLRATRLIEDFSVPGMMQETALHLVTAQSWPRHLRMLRAELRRRRDLLASALARHPAMGTATLPPGGLHLWLRLPPGVSDAAVAAEASRQDVLVSAGHHWFPAEAPDPYLRLSFAAVEPDWVDEAVATLAAIVVQAVARAG
jgi:DNA-binding transcriptional MocR family regulator